MPPLSVLVDGQREATAIVGVSEVTINVGATFGGDTKLRYQVDYGDGQSSPQTGPKHVYASTGTFHVTVTVTDAAGRQASTAQDVSVSAVNGAWFQFGINEVAHRFETRRLSIEQDGTQVRGTYSANGDPDRRIAGQLTAGRRITLATDDGSVKFEGELPVSLSDAGYPLTLIPAGSADGQAFRLDPAPRGAPPTPPHAALRFQTGIPGFNPSFYLSYYGAIDLYAGWEVTFDATQSTGDGLSFVIDFDDGSFATTSVARHTFMTVRSGSDSWDESYRAERRSIRAWVVDRFGRADSAPLPARLIDILTNSVTTNYIGGFQNPATGRVELLKLNLLRQNATQLTGTYQNSEVGTTPLTATLSGSNHIHLRLDDGTIEMDGTFTWQPPPPFDFGHGFILNVRGGSADGTTLRFDYHDCC
ncbi:MAG TPA: PKD domain-containing protein [Vicinamibacterales bacterium]